MLSPLKRSVLIFALFLMGAAFVSSASAQSTCKCEDSGNTATASCPAGLMALCACSTESCNSRCVKPSPPAPKNLDIGAFVQTLKTTAPGEIGDVLSKSLGRVITFETPIKNFKFDYPPSKTGSSTHWDVLEVLAAKGKLMVNGHDIEFWKAQRDNLLGGGEIIISTGGGTAQAILNEIFFITGKRFSITSGNANALIAEPVTGSGLGQVVQNLSKIGKVTIVEN
jgi:hypothetical protein